MAFETGPGGRVARAGSEVQPAAALLHGSARERTPLGFTGGDLLIYKSIMLLAGGALPVIAAVNWFLRGTLSWPQLGLAGAIFAGGLACWTLSRKGRKEIAAALLIGMLWCTATIYAFKTGYGMHSAAVFIYLPCVLYTALFFGIAIAAAELALTVAALVVMYYAEAQGQLGGAALFAAHGTSFNFLLGVILTAVGTLIVSLVYHRHIERDANLVAAEAERRRLAMEQAQMAQAQLETANARLQALNAELAERSRRHELATVRARRDYDLAHEVLSGDIPESLAALRSALAAPDAQTEAKLQREIGRIEAVTAALAELGRDSEPDLRREHLDLSAIAHAAARELRARPKYARVVFDVDSGLRAYGDTAGVTALLRHLVKRAAASCHGEPDPVVHVGSGSIEGRAVFFVRDNGPGMDEAERAKLFRPFGRDGMENTVDVGIVSARRIAERHGGTLEVDSAPGRGATWLFTLG